jgi:hypothetical protein
MQADPDGSTQRRKCSMTQRGALVEQVAGSLLGGVREPVLSCALDYWKRIDPGVGQSIADLVRSARAMPCNRRKASARDRSNSCDRPFISFAVGWFAS